MSGTLTMVLAALGAELILLLVALLAFSWFRNRAVARRDHKAIQVLVKRIKGAKAERETVIDRFLSERMGLSGSVLEQARSAMLHAELLLLQRFATVYRKRDASAAAKFDIDLTAALVPYHGLQANGEGAPPGHADVGGSELEAMRAENRRLSAELSGTMETMSRMLEEYSTLFSGGVPGQANPIASADGGTGVPDEGGGPFEGDPSAPFVEYSAEEPRDEGVPQDDLDDLFNADDEVVVEAPEPGGGLADAGLEPTAVVAAQPPPGSAEQPAVDQVVEDAKGADASETVESGEQDDGATAVVESADNPAVAAGEPDETLSGTQEAGKEPIDEPAQNIEESSKISAVQSRVEPGDDLDSVNELLEEGEVELMAFDEEDEFDTALAGSEEDLFDSAEPAETSARVDAVLGAAVDGHDDIAADSRDEMFDAGENLFDADGIEPRKTQAGG